MARRRDISWRTRLRHLFANFGLKVLALALAVVFWFFITGGRQVYRELEVPVEIHGVPDGYVVNGDVPKRVSVRVVGKGRAILRAKAADFKVVVNVAPAEPGVHRFDLAPSDVIYAGEGDVHVDAILSEKVLMLELERRITKGVAVQVDFTGTPAAGLCLGLPEVRPPKVTLYGSAAVLDGLTAVSVPVDVNGRVEGFTTRVVVRTPPGMTLVGADEADVKVILGPPVRKTFPQVPVTIKNAAAWTVKPDRAAVTLEGEAGRLDALKAVTASVAPAAAGPCRIRVEVPEYTRLVAVTPLDAEARPGPPAP